MNLLNIFFKTKWSSHIWLKLLILMSIVVVGFLLYKKYYPTVYSEGFSQNERFVAKYNDQIYDEFYSEVYDDLNKPNRRIPYEIQSILKQTQSDTSNSRFLDIGSGTGGVVDALAKKGYEVVGLDKSKDMIEHAEQKYPSAQYVLGDVMEPLTFEKTSFSHVLCLYHTIYQFSDKVAFFRNCHHWLKPGGYLVVHLVDRDHFDTTVPAAKNILFGSPRRFYEDRITDSVMNFKDFKYKVSYQFDKNTHHVAVLETFVDHETSNVRQNEQTLYMEEINDIITTANYCGFIPHGKIDLAPTTDDKYQFLYIFERIL
jgi:SAM-dependent methyltransferase